VDSGSPEPNGRHTSGTYSSAASSRLLQYLDFGTFLSSDAETFCLQMKPLLIVFKKNIEAWKIEFHT
jgi:hypothetical protein